MLPVLPLCPGVYCGRSQFDNGSLSHCAACQRGYRPNHQSICVKCDESPQLYDWLYLGFMAFLPLLLHCVFIDYTNKKKGAPIALYISAILESFLACTVTLLLFEPMGSFDLVTCSVRHVADWYTMLYNPSPDFKTTIHCTQEIVYPLYTIVMVEYGFCLLLLFLARLVVSRNFAGGNGTRSIYSALYFIPILIVLQAVLGGLLYYSFPYIILIVSAVTNVVHLAYYTDQTVKGIFLEIIRTPRNIIILLSHWLLYIYGIVAILRIEKPAPNLAFITVVPLPTLFYILTVHFSDPDCLHLINMNRN